MRVPGDDSGRNEPFPDYRDGDPARPPEEASVPQKALAHNGIASDRGRLRAAWSLVLLTTLCAELTFTAVAVPLTWLLSPLLVVMYGAGVLVVREAVVRAGGGWPSLALLGVAYQLVEDGLGLQALTSPRMYGAADWGWRVLGVNWTYWESQIGVHVVFSVLIPVMLTDLLFPAHRARPYLRPRGLVGACVAAAVGVLGLRTIVAATEDPGYQATWGWITGIVVAVATLGVLALRVLPRRTVPVPSPTSTTPKPPTVGIAAAVVTLVFLGLLLPPGLRTESLFGPGIPLSIPLALAAAVALGSGCILLRWRATTAWSDRHRIWLAGGILLAHTAFMVPASPVSIATGTLTLALEVVLLRMLTRHIESRRDADDVTTP